MVNIQEVSEVSCARWGSGGSSRALPSSSSDDDDDFGFSVVIILEGSTVRKYCMILYCCSLLDTYDTRYGLNQKAAIKSLFFDGDAC